MTNFIFRNQPNHSYFDKPFDESDCLFLLLNEIDPHFLKPEQQADSLNVSNIIVKDPRTQKPVTQYCYDHTQQEQFKLFQSPKKSTMNAKQHELGVRVVNALQQCLEVEEEDMFQWYRMEKNRLKEKEEFQRYVLDYHHSNKEFLYSSCRKLKELYRKWYKTKVKDLIDKYPQESYNTHLGLPQVRQCKNVLKESKVVIRNQEVIRKLGKSCKLPDNIAEELNNINCSLETYLEIYLNSLSLKDSLGESLRSQFIKSAEEDFVENPLFYMPLESLIFLLTAGEYIDMPTEMLLNIKEIEETGGISMKYIIMDEPLPSRQLGTHSYQKVVHQAVLAMVSVKQKTNLEDEDLNINKTPQIPITYKVSTWQEFMQKTQSKPDKLCQFCKSLIKWELSNSEDDSSFLIHSSLNCLPDSRDFSVKLEYKPRFGCEVMSKYEMLSEWFKLKLSSAPKSKLLRLDATNLRFLLEESLTLRNLEFNLLNSYQINCQELLNNLYEFLKMLYNMPAGHYMLRFNPKFKDKLMLCKPSQEITQNTIHLHQLLQSEVSDENFMSQPHFLPINDNLCSQMHLQHKILPAAFDPRAKNAKKLKIKTGSDLAQNKFKHSFSSRQKRSFAVPTKPQSKASNKSKMKRAKRRQKEFAARQAADEQKELEREMELDRKMLEI